MYVQVKRIMARFTKAAMVMGWERWVEVMHETKDQKRKMTRFIQLYKNATLLLAFENWREATALEKENLRLKKKQIVQDLIPPFSMYIHMCTLYAYTNI